MRESLELRVRRLGPMGALPTRSHQEDVGLDLYAAESLVIAPGRWATVGTGIAIELPPGTEGQIRPRSGLAEVYGVTVLNSPGTVDEGYRGEIKVLLMNHGTQPFCVRCGGRIAQLVVQRRVSIDIVEVDYVTETSRGEGGFGSTGE